MFRYRRLHLLTNGLHAQIVQESIETVFSGVLQHQLICFDANRFSFFNLGRFAFSSGNSFVLYERKSEFRIRPSFGNGRKSARSKTQRTTTAGQRAQSLSPVLPDVDLSSAFLRHQRTHAFTRSHSMGHLRSSLHSPLIPPSPSGGFSLLHPQFSPLRPNWAAPNRSASLSSVRPTHLAIPSTPEFRR